MSGDKAFFYFNFSSPRSYDTKHLSQFCQVLNKQNPPLMTHASDVHIYNEFFRPENVCDTISAIT